MNKKAHPDTNRLLARISRDTLRHFRDSDRETWDFMWRTTKARIKAETGLTQSGLYARTWNAMGTLYREDDPEEWARVRKQIRARLEAETGWQDHRPYANKNRRDKDG